MNQALKSALQQYDEVRDNYIGALEAKGVRFAAPGAGEQERSLLRADLLARGVQSRNGGASLSWGWLSPACVECTGNRGSETFSTTFKCHRDCYFCFNHNQADYDRFFEEGCPWEEGLERAAQTYDDLAVIGLTGGEPLLVLDDSIRFLERAGELFPSAHKRMYTSGDLLTAEGAVRLRDAGLEEIRFSVKDFDPETMQERVLSAMVLAREHIPSVMVEMPIIPGTDERMYQLFDRFEEIGIDGINLLEFCFPFHSWEEFEKRGLVVRNPPFDVMYDYGYSGGLPIAGSEELALKLMGYALDRGYGFGMHYCSLDNKHRSEMRQKNERAAHVHPCVVFDEDNFFLRTAKVFGPDRGPAEAALEAAGCTDFMEDGEERSLAFPPHFSEVLEKAENPETGDPFEVADCLMVAETEGGSSYLMEVALLPRIGE